LKWLRRQDSNLLQTTKNKGILWGGTEKWTGFEKVPADLLEFVAAWSKLPSSLQKAILAIVSSAQKVAP